MIKAIASDGSCHRGLGKEDSPNSLMTPNTPIILIILNNYCLANMRNKK